MAPPDTFEEALTTSTPEPFRPRAWYNQSGDTLEVVLSSEEELEERIDDVVALLRGAESKKIIGFTIKRLSRFLKDNASVKIVFRSREVSFEALFTAVAVARAQSIESRQLFERVLREFPSELHGTTVAFPSELATV